MAASPVARSVSSLAGSPTATARVRSAGAPPGRDILAAIGNTPMLEIPSLAPGPDVRLFAKLEGFNPTGSVKDRIALALIESLEQRGRLGPGTILLEATSGNTGIALALVARRRGYPITLVMPDNVTPERRALAEAYGATIIDSSGDLGSNGAIALARQLAAADQRYALVDQYANEANASAHEASTGPEILWQCPDIEVFVAGLGTSGTLMGVARYLRRMRPGVRIVAAEPLPGSGVQGLRSLDDGFIPEIFDPTLLDRRFLVSNREAVQGVRALLEGEGIFAGLSSGAILVAARRIAREMPRATIVALLPDGGWKYLSAGIFSADLDELEDRLDAGGLAW